MDCIVAAGGEAGCDPVQPLCPEGHMELLGREAVDDGADGAVGIDIGSAEEKDPGV